jgi:hypothetical protein
MGIDPTFLALMPETIIITHPDTLNNLHGKRTYTGTATNVRCRIQNKGMLIRAADGKETVTTGRVYCYGIVSVSVGDKLTLPDGTSPVILSVDNSEDEAGGYCTVIHFGKES